jgi:hypothetical protein
MTKVCIITLAGHMALEDLMGWYEVRAAEAAKTRKQPAKPVLSRSPRARPLTGASKTLSPSATHGSRRGSTFSVDDSTLVEGNEGEGEGEGDGDGEGATVVGETGYDFAGISVPPCFRFTHLHTLTHKRICTHTGRYT